LLWLSIPVLLLQACQGTPTIAERAHAEGQAPIRLPELIEIPAPQAISVELITPEISRPRIGSEELISFEMRGIPLANAIHMAAEMAQVNIFLDAGLEMPIDASFPSIRLDDALDVLLDQNGLRLVEEPAGVYWVRQEDGSQPAKETFRVNSIDVASIEEDLAKLVNEGGRLVVNPEQNFVFVDGTQRDVQLVREYIHGVDRLKRQVLLEVEIVELILDENFQMGISLDLADKKLGDTSNLFSLAQNLSTGSGEFSISIDNAAVPLQTTLTALQQYVGVNVVSSPRILAVTKSPAKVEVITEIPFVKATVSTDVGAGNAGSATIEEVEFKKVGITMDVTPTIQEGGTVEVRIDQKFSNVIEFFQGIPVVDERLLSTVMLIQDGHTVVIGGLQQNSIIEDDTGVPLLMHIPFLGRLFRSDNDSTQKRQLLVFITPRILDSSQAAQLSHQFKHEYSETRRLSGVSDLEDE